MKKGLIKIDFSNGAVMLSYKNYYYTINREKTHTLGQHEFFMDNMVWNGEIYKLTKNRTYIYLY